MFVVAIHAWIQRHEFGTLHSCGLSYVSFGEQSIVVCLLVETGDDFARSIGEPAVPLSSDFLLRDGVISQSFCAPEIVLGRLEVQHGCISEHPPVFKYRMRELVDSESP